MPDISSAPNTTAADDSMFVQSKRSVALAPEIVEILIPTDYTLESS